MPCLQGKDMVTDRVAIANQALTVKYYKWKLLKYFSYEIAFIIYV
jgi:hypothetical protein